MQDENKEQIILFNVYSEKSLPLKEKLRVTFNSCPLLTCLYIILFSDRSLDSHGVLGQI